MLTRVNCSIEGDVFYPKIDFNRWKLEGKEDFFKNDDNQYDFSIETYSKL